MIGQEFLNSKDLFSHFHTKLIDNSYANLLLPGDMKENAVNDLRSQPGEQHFNNNPQPKARNVELTFLIECRNRCEYLLYLEELYKELDKDIFLLNITPLKRGYKLKRISYLSLVPLNDGSKGKLIVNVRELNPSDRIKL
ncbi:MAG: hypothetical protein ACK5LF_21345 [Bacteroides xylanisolvens]